jgi:hypothetical protein
MGYKNSDPCIQKAFDDERLFVLMARDKHAPAAVIEWIKLSLGSQPPDKLHEALDAAIEMNNERMNINSRKGMPFEGMVFRSPHLQPPKDREKFYTGGIDSVP